MVHGTGQSSRGCTHPLCDLPARHPAAVTGGGAGTPVGTRLCAPSARPSKNATVSPPARPMGTSTFRGRYRHRDHHQRTHHQHHRRRRPTAPTQARPNQHYTLPGVPWLAVDLNTDTVNGADGTLTIGTFTIPVQLTPATENAPARIDVDPGTAHPVRDLRRGGVGRGDRPARRPAQLAGARSSAAIAVAHVGLDDRPHRPRHHRGRDHRHRRPAVAGADRPVRGRRPAPDPGLHPGR